MIHLKFKGSDFRSMHGSYVLSLNTNLQTYSNGSNIENLISAVSELIHPGIEDFSVELMWATKIHPHP